MHFTKDQDMLNMKERYADLHVHTFFSDSTFSPEEVIKTADKMGVDTIAITDHDCIDAIPISIEEGKKYGIEIIPGIEMTVEEKDTEVHILGYFIEWESSWLKEKLKVLQDSRVDRIYKMIGLLKEHGVEVNPQEVFHLAGKGSVGRLHLAMAMYRTRKIRNIQEAFTKYIGHSKPCHVPHMRFSTEDAIKMILKVKGVPVLAHPAIMARDEFIKEFIKYGLRGIEVYHTDHSPGTSRRYLKIAQENDLLATGGSDCHGLGKGRVLIGLVKVKHELVDKLREEAEKIRKK